MRRKTFARPSCKRLATVARRLCVAIQNASQVILSHEVDLGEEVQKLLDADMELDEDHVDMLKAAACVLAVATVKKVKANAKELKCRRKRKKKSVWVREWMFNRLKYGMYEKLMKHLRDCLLYTSPSPRDGLLSRMPSSA